MSGLAVEDLLALWSAELREAKARLRSLFARAGVAASAAAFLDGLLGPERRKTGWMRAEAAGDSGPWRQQAVLGRSHWDADALRDVVRDYAVETLADPDAVLVIDETGDWVRLSAGDGTKGPRLYDWAYLELADLDPEMVGAPPGLGTWTRGLLVRRRLSDGDLALFTTWCPEGTPLATLVAVEGRRWAIEDAFETAKSELGLDHNETRSWRGWHRHVSLVMLAFALLMVVRHKAEAHAAPPKNRSGARHPWSAGPSRRSGGLPSVWPSAGSNPRG